jgi:cytoskeletal protein CcmA (bactofilin family)
MKVLRVLALAAMVMALFPMRADAADIRQGQQVIIAPNETVDDDLYAFATTTVQISGTVNGDVVAAGNNVSIDGTVNGSVTVAAQTLSIRGQVTGTVRAAGNSVFVDGKIGGDLFAAGNEVTTTASSKITRDAVAAGNTMTFSGQIGRYIRASGASLTIDGAVGNNVSATVERLTLTARAAIDGSLWYTSPQDATIASGATVRGQTSRTAPPAGPTSVAPGPAAFAIDWLRGLVGLLLLGLFLVLFFPAFARRSGEALVRSPFVSLGVGCLVLIGIPAVAVLLFIVGGLIGGWWLGLVALAFYFAAIAVSLPVSALGVGASIMRVTGRPAQLVIALVVGLIVLLLVGAVPILGAVVLFIAVLFGLGGTAIAVAGGRRSEIAPA